MWNDGANVQALVYNGPSQVISSAIRAYLEKSIELGTHVMASEEFYVVPSSVTEIRLPAGNYQVFIKGVIHEQKKDVLV